VIILNKEAEEYYRELIAYNLKMELEGEINFEEMI
jgi:hypothetical protein